MSALLATTLIARIMISIRSYRFDLGSVQSPSVAAPRSEGYERRPSHFPDDDGWCVCAGAWTGKR
jgi:hypothetical protein